MALPSGKQYCEGQGGRISGASPCSWPHILSTTFLITALTNPGSAKNESKQTKVKERNKS